MPRPQFSIRTLLWLTLVVAAFLGGSGLAERRWSEERATLKEALRKNKFRMADYDVEVSKANMRIDLLESDLSELRFAGKHGGK